MSPHNSDPPGADPFHIASITEALGAASPDVAHSECSANRAAVAMILHEAASAPDSRPAPGDSHRAPTVLEALFIKRVEHPSDPWSGHVAMPGGREETGDATLEEVARRETIEEIGLDLRAEMLIGRLDDIGGGRLRPHELSVSTFVYYYPGALPSLTPQATEIDDIVSVPLTYLADSGNLRSYQYPPDPLQRDFPSFPLGEEAYTLWGMTFRMIGNFMRLFDVDLPDEPTSRDAD